MNWAALMCLNERCVVSPLVPAINQVDDVRFDLKGVKCHHGGYESWIEGAEYLKSATKPKTAHSTRSLVPVSSEEPRICKKLEY